MARASYQRIDGIHLGRKAPKPLKKVVAAKPAPISPATSSFVIPKPLRAVLTLKHQ
jgi:hypothetical protein